MDIEDILKQIKRCFSNVTEHIEHKDYNNALCSLSEIEQLTKEGQEIVRMGKIAEQLRN